MHFLKQNSSNVIKIGPFLSINNESIPLLSESPIVLLSKNGGQLTQKNETSIPESDNYGYYNCLLNGTDTNTIGTLRLIISPNSTTKHIAPYDFQVIVPDVYDSLFGINGIVESANDIASATLREPILNHTNVIGSLAYHIFNNPINTLKKFGITLTISNVVSSSDITVSNAPAALTQDQLNNALILHIPSGATSRIKYVSLNSNDRTFVLSPAFSTTPIIGDEVLILAQYLDSLI